MALIKNPAVWLAALFISLIFWGISTNNHIITLQEGVKEKQAQVENVYQRRLDLIPNLVNTVKGYAKHESEVLTAVTQARSQVGQVKINDPASLKQFDQAQGALSNALSRLMVVVEKYPELKADKNFLELQSQLEGTENRITIERQRFNESTKDYNTTIKRFPASLLASMRNFTAFPYFESQPNAKQAPKVEF